MTPKKWSLLLGALIVAIGYAIPLFFIFSMYVSLETTTSAMSMQLVGVFASIFLVLGLLKWIKKRILIKRELGFSINPYVAILPHILPQLSGVLIFTWFLSVVKGEIQTLFNLMLIWSVCALLAFILKLVQLHFDKLANTPPTA